MVALLAGIASSAVAANSAVLVGLTPADDAAVYALDDKRALVATVDCFPPIVDDPSDYGAVAAANAVSDVYAMGGSVAFALVVCGFPASVPQEIIAAVNRAAAATVGACGGSVIGGHSVRCQEPIFGLCVFGFVHPQRIWTKAGAQPGDVLLLSKPIGTGILLSSRLKPEERIAVASMRITNQDAAAALQAMNGRPHAVTDVSGYGLIGHAQEMAIQSRVLLHIDSAQTPLLQGAAAAALKGVRTSAHRTETSALDRSDEPRFGEGVSVPMRALMQDPQTSGGLLAAVAPPDATQLERAGFTRIGTVLAGTPGVMVS